MAYYGKKVLRDADGIPIPQVWDPDADSFKPYESSTVDTGGVNAVEPFEDNKNRIFIFSKNIRGFCISNDGTASLTFKIGPHQFTVRAGEVFKSSFEPFTQVEVTSNGVPFRAFGLGGAIAPPPQATQGDIIPPNNVTDLQAVAFDTRITLSWKASTSLDTVSYTILRGNTEIATGVSGTSYTAIGLVPMTSYTFTVRAVDANANANTGSPITISTLADASPPPVPAAPIVVEGNGVVNLTWVAVSAPDLAGYHVYRNNVKLTGTTPVVGTSYQAVSVNGIAASFRISSIDTGGNESALSVVSATVTPSEAGAFPNGAINIRDTFTSPDGAFTIRNEEGADLRQWSSYGAGSAYAIATNMLAITTNSYGESFLGFDTLTADCTVEMKYSGQLNYSKLVMRWIDKGNQYFIMAWSGQWIVCRRVANSATEDLNVTYNVAKQSVFVNDVVRAEFRGDRLRVWINGILRFNQAGLTAGNTGTKHGLGNNSDAATTGVFDNFKLTEATKV